MKHRWRTLVCAAALLLTGCAATFWWGNRQATLRLGMTQQQVRAALGPPQQVLTRQLQDMLVDTWTYLDRTVIFHNGVVFSWNAQP